MTMMRVVKLWLLAWLCPILWAGCLPGKLDHQGFIAYLTPIIHTENQRIAEKRMALLKLHGQWQDTGQLSPEQHQLVARWSQTLHVPPSDPNQQPPWQILINRMDTIPTMLILAQAILESGYGQSRFAQAACNLFGQQCFTKGCGLVPKQRDANKTHEIKRFDSIEHSVHAYMINLNTHPAYRIFREKRAHLRHLHRAQDPIILAKTLTSYAEIGESYGMRLTQLIRALQKD